MPGGGHRSLDSSVLDSRGPGKETLKIQFRFSNVRERPCPWSTRSYRGPIAQAFHEPSVDFPLVIEPFRPRSGNRPLPRAQIFERREVVRMDSLIVTGIRSEEHTSELQSPMY